MQLIIEIPDHIYQSLVETGKYGYYRFDAKKAIKNGEILPKGHSNLIEANEDLFQHIRKYAGKDAAYEIFSNAPIIIQADKRG